MFPTVASTTQYEEKVIDSDCLMPKAKTGKKVDATD